MKRIAIISDSHGLLQDQVKNELHKADYIIHAGDVDTPDIVEYMRQCCETYVVRGNNDKDWAKDLPESLFFTIEGVRFFLVHDKKDIPKDLNHVDVVIYGHSHQYSAETVNGVLFLNPGYCGKKRFLLQLSMCRMTVEEGHYEYEKIVIPSKKS